MPPRSRTRPDLAFEPGERRAMDAESARIAAALSAAGMRPQGPGFPHVAWRKHVMPMLRRRMPRAEGPTAAAVAALLAGFARNRGDPLAYVRLPLAVAVASLPGDHGPEPGRMDALVAAQLSEAAFLVAAFVASAPGRVTTARSGTAR